MLMLAVGCGGQTAPVIGDLNPHVAAANLPDANVDAAESDGGSDADAAPNGDYDPIPGPPPCPPGERFCFGCTGPLFCLADSESCPADPCASLDDAGIPPDDAGADESDAGCTLVCGGSCWCEMIGGGPVCECMR